MSATEQNPATQEPDESGVVIEGHVTRLKDLSYGERRELRRIAKVELGDGDLDEVTEEDYEIAFALVALRRSDPHAKLEDVLAWKPGDVSLAEGAEVPTSEDEPVEAESSSPSASSSKRRTAKGT